jgi:Reverse transcriptase (RNA-dependent DNA polymerase)
MSSAFFNITNGVRQGGILSPFLFRFYIRDLIDRVTTLNLGCYTAGTVINLLAHADDICLYDAVLWSNFTVTAVNKLSSCYTECIKSFFNYAKYSSVTAMLLELGLQSFSTLNL